MATTLALFALVALVTIATPGPTVLLALANGSRWGVRVALAGIAGAAVSDVVLVAAAAIGLGALLAASEVAFEIVKWIGVAYLAWLGVRLLGSKGAFAVPGGDAAAVAPPRGRAVFMRSFLVAVTNPKGYLFVSAFLPQFVSPAEPQAAQYVVLGIVFVALDAAVMLVYAALGVQAIRALRGNGIVWIDRICGGTLLALAGSLAVYRRSA